MTIRSTLPSALNSAKDAHEAFYDALSRADTEAMLAVWADDDNVCCVHPGGPRLLGKALISQAWTAMLKNGGVNVQVVDLRVLASSPDSEVHHLLEQVVVRNGNQVQIVQVPVVNVYVKDANNAMLWKMLAHHAGQALLLESPKATNPSTDTNHLLGSSPSGMLH